MGQDSEMEVDSQAELTDQSSYLAPDTSRTRKERRVKEEEKTLEKKKGLGVKRNNEEAMEDGSSVGEDRGPMLGITDVEDLMEVWDS